jgi:seryl-tRNA synthetase
LLDLKLIREQPDMIRGALVALNATAPLDEILSLDESRRQVVTDVESLKAKRNDGSKEVGRTKDAERRSQLIEEMRQLGDEIAEKDEQVRVMDEELYSLLLQMPNLPLAGVPVAPDESGNVVTKTVEVERARNFTVRPHWEIG